LNHLGSTFASFLADTHSYRTMRIAAITFFTLLTALAGHVHAQPAPATSNRILKTFNFDERKQGNDEDQPMNWQKVEGTDFPHYVIGRLTTDRHRNSDYSFRMDLDGGSCVYRYQPGLLKIQPGAHYRLEGYCQTTVLRYARARLTAYFTDQDQHVLADTVVHSEVYTSDGSDADWHPLSVELTAAQEHAYYLVIQMELLQPNQYSVSSLGKRSLFLQDVHGTAWFTDLTIAQVPQVVLKTDRPGNVFRAGDPLKLTVQINDRELDDLTVQLLVDDAANRRVYQHTGAVSLATAKSLSPVRRELSLDLPQVPPGWYRASLVLMSNGVYVGQESLSWILLADTGEIGPPDSRFGVTATDLPFENWDQLPRFLPLLSVGRVKLSLWSSGVDVQKMESGNLDQILESLQQESISPTGCLLALPPKVADQVNGSNWLQLLNAPADAWQTPLAFLISRHANRVDRWQIGEDQSDQFALNPDMRKVYSKVLQQFSNLVDRPDLAMPCPLLYELPNPRPTSLTLSVPSSILPDEIPLYLQEYQAQDSSTITLSLQLLDGAYTRETRISDLARRVVYAMTSNVPRIDLPLPIVARQQGDEQIAEPQESALIMRTLLSTLSGARFSGKLPIGPGIEAFLFDRGGDGIVVLWSRDDIAEAKPIAVSLGEHPVCMDLWGNAAALLQLSPPAGDDEESVHRRAASGMVQLRVGRMPLILTGIDSNMGRLRASLAFDKPLIESSFQSHTRHIHFTNPYTQPIGGTLKLHAPPGWNLTPPSFDFTLNAGETFDRELTIEFPYNSIAGPQPVFADLDVQADRHISFTEPVALSLGLSDVGTQCMAFRDGTDIIVQQMITNYGEAPIAYSAYANYPGRPRIERLVTSLNPGQTAVKKYRFTNVPAGTDSKIRVGLKEVEGNRILNDQVDIK
jgi:hypothetical protein